MMPSMLQCGAATPGGALHAPQIHLHEVEVMQRELHGLVSHHLVHQRRDALGPSHVLRLKHVLHARHTTNGPSHNAVRIAGETMQGGVRMVLSACAVDYGTSADERI